ncbi:MAG: class I SAM-dependent methyltransferase [Acidimicrobiales bacterium]|nr:class I SAM-dependent methyltransferase [Acidimicrobiales bacterium]HJM72727.1 class I SAM-dependent methyltransferase [Acidimicrobiales bacterium]
MDSVPEAPSPGGIFSTDDARSDRSTEVLAHAVAARGFMPPDEGLALFDHASSVGQQGIDGPWLEIGSYCGKSACYLGAAAEAAGRQLFTLDHHRGSEENQADWEHHEPDLVDPAIGRMDTLPIFRRTIHDAGLEGTVVAIVGDSPSVAAVWQTPLALLFIDGGHGTEPAHRDYEGWVPHLAIGGLLLIHDVFAYPADGGRPPFEIWSRAVGSGAFTEVNAVGSLRVLRRTGSGI